MEIYFAQGVNYRCLYMSRWGRVTPCITYLTEYDLGFFFTYLVECGAVVFFSAQSGAIFFSFNMLC